MVDSFRFYFQAVFYIFVFRHRQLLEDNKGLHYVMGLNLERIVTCRLNPIRVCLPSIVNVFATLTRYFETTTNVFFNLLLKEHYRICKKTKSWGSQIYIKLTRSDDDNSRKHPLKYFCLKCHIWWEILVSARHKNKVVFHHCSARTDLFELSIPCHFAWKLE